MKDFKLKYEEIKKAFAPIIFIKTPTPILQGQNCRPLQQLQSLQISMSRINGEEVMLEQQAVVTEKIIQPNIQMIKIVSKQKVMQFSIKKYQPNLNFRYYSSAQVFFK